jgi:hypothetical protein
VLDGTPKPKKGQKKQDKLKLRETNPLKYNHVRTFIAVATAILLSEPGTTILSIIGDSPEITTLKDIPTEEGIVKKYYDNNNIYISRTDLHLGDQTLLLFDAE